MQGVHRIAARRAGGGSTVPVLVTPDGALGESEEILAWVDERTLPEHRLFRPSRASSPRSSDFAGASTSASDRPAGG